METKDPNPPEAPTPVGFLDQDERWETIQRIASSVNFRTSPRLRQFLIYIAERSLAGRVDEIKEYEIGWNVFGRRADYNTLEDSIVRSSARQLRKKLAEYYGSEGREEAWLVEIPKGHYEVTFTRKHNGSEATEVTIDVLRRWQIFAGLLTLALVTLAIVTFQRFREERGSRGMPATIASTMFDGDRSAKIIVGDYGIILLSVVNNHVWTAEEYANRRFPDSLTKQSTAFPIRQMWDGLSNGHAAYFYDGLIAGDIIRLAAQNGRNATLQHARQTTVEDFRSGNVFLVGVPASIPWINLIANKLNFRFHIEQKEDARKLEFVNTRPLPGEKNSYAADPGSPNLGLSYAVVARVPNLSGTGKILLIQGLRSPGTLAAGDFVTGSAGMEKLQNIFKVTDGLPDFEVLLETDSIATSQVNTRIVAVRKILP